MRSSFLVFLFFFTLSFAATANDRDMPKIRKVELKPITTFVADILPGRGIKLIFPWVLDESSTELPFSEQLTNTDIFEVLVEPGQNHIIYKIKENNYNIEGELSDIFINVAGFHINMTLRASFSKKAHKSNIEFFLNKKDRLELIQRAINRRKEALVKEYDKKIKELDKRAEHLALKLVGRLATGPSKKFRVKVEETTKLENGDRIMFYCDKIINYGSFAVIPIEIGNESNMLPLYVQNISLEKLSSDGISSTPLISEFEVKEQKIVINEVTKGFIVTRDMKLLSKGESKAVLFTNRGKCEVIW